MIFFVLATILALVASRFAPADFYYFHFKTILKVKYTKSTSVDQYPLDKTKPSSLFFLLVPPLLLVIMVLIFVRSGMKRRSKKRAPARESDQ